MECDILFYIMSCKMLYCTVMCIMKSPIHWAWMLVLPAWEFPKNPAPCLPRWPLLLPSSSIFPALPLSVYSDCIFQDILHRRDRQPLTHFEPLTWHRWAHGATRHILPQKADNTQCGLGISAQVPSPFCFLTLCMSLCLSLSLTKGSFSVFFVL